MIPIRTTLAVAAITTLLFGCGTVGDAVESQLRLAGQTYPPLTEWACQAGRSHLIVDAKGITGFGRFSLEGAAIQRHGDSASPIFVRAVDAKAFGSWDSVALFPNLEPGTYSVRQLRLHRANATLTTPVPAADAFTVSLEPGKVVYIGRIVFEEKPGFPATRKTTLENEPDRRTVAFKIISDKFPNSACISLLKN